MLVQIVGALVPGGKAVLLCDDAGEPLPMQTRASVENGIDEPATITVTFRIDGKIIRFAD